MSGDEWISEVLEVLFDVCPKVQSSKFVLVYISMPFKLDIICFEDNYRFFVFMQLHPKTESTLMHVKKLH